MLSISVGNVGNVNCNAPLDVRDVCTCVLLPEVVDDEYQSKPKPLGDGCGYSQ
jgi:hypothetical protein